MLYVAAAQPATVQLSAIQSNFLLPNTNSLIVNHLTRLEILSISEEPASTQLVLEIPIWETIACLKAIHLAGDTTSTLIILTTSLQLFTLHNSATTSPPSIVTSSTISLSEPYARPADLVSINLDPKSRCILIQAYTGLLRVIPLPKGRKGAGGWDLGKGWNVRLPSMNVHSLEFLPFTSSSSSTDEDTREEGDEDEEEEEKEKQTFDRPTFAIISTDHLGRKLLTSHLINLQSKSLEPGPLSEKLLADVGSEWVVPVGNYSKSSNGNGTTQQPQKEEGVLILGEETIHFIPRDLISFDPSKSKGKNPVPIIPISRNLSVPIPVGLITAWTKLSHVNQMEGKDDEEGGGEGGDRWLVGDIYGKLLFVELERDQKGFVIEVKVRDLGDASSPTSFVHLSPTLLYLSSRFADSQLIRLPAFCTASPTATSASAMVTDDEEEEEEEEGIQLVASYASLAPILDCCVVEAEGGGASQVVTCSGAYKGGSLRVVRQGVGLTELANLEMEGVQRIWAVGKGQKFDELLVLSSFNETRILAFAPSTSSEITEEEEAPSLEIEEIEIPAFTSTTSTLLSGSLLTLVFQVTSAGIGYTGFDFEESKNWKVEGGKKITLGCLDRERGTIVLAVEGGVVVLLREVAGEIVQVETAQLSNEIACLDVATIGSQSVLSVGLWTSQTVSLFSLPSLAPLSTQILTTDFLIRSVLLTTFQDGTHQLFIGLGDGTLTSFVVNDASEIVESSRKTVTLGSRPIVMCSFETKGGRNVFVSSDRPTVISRKGDKLVYSSVNLKNISAVVAFNSSVYPSSLALTSPTELQIGRIDEIQRVDIKAIPLEDDEPRRIVHDPVTKTYGVVCLRRDINRVTGVQNTRGMFKIFDDQTFEVLADIPMQLQEEGQSIVLLTSGESTCYVVGTTFVKPSESEPTSGRLLVFAEKEGRTFEQTNEIAIAGSPYALAVLADHHVAAAINSLVEVFSIDPTSHLLVPVAKWGGAFISLNLVSGPDNTLLVGDAMRSLTLLRFAHSPYRIEEIARDYNAHYMSAVEAISGKDGADKGEYIGAETDFNLFTVMKENTTNARSMADEYSLSPRAAFHLGEMVSKFKHGSLVQHYGDGSGGIAPQLIFATSAGSVGVIVELDDASSKMLSDLERNMRGVVKGIGGLKQEDWRSFKSERKVLPSAGFVDGDFVERFLELTSEEIDAVLLGGTGAEKLSVGREEVMRLVEELSRMH